MKRPKVYTSGDDPNQYLRDVETYADHLEKALKDIADLRLCENIETRGMYYRQSGKMLEEVLKDIWQ